MKIIAIFIRRNEGYRIKREREKERERERERETNGVIFFGEGGINEMKDIMFFVLFFFFIEVLTSKDTCFIEYGT